MSKKRISRLVAGLAVLSISLVGCGTAGQSEAGGGSKPVGELFDYTITGIEPGSGANRIANEAVKEYDLDGWQVRASSSAAMMAALDKAYSQEEPILVTAWTPHWMIERYDLKFLKDPKGVLGDPDSIHTLTRLGLEEDLPNAYRLLDQFQWNTKDMTTVMSMLEEGMAPEEAANKWISKNPEQVDKWLKGVEQGDGQTITIAHAVFQDNVASSYVVAQVLKEKGYKVDLKQVAVAPAFAGIASGTADAYLGAVLPDLYASYYKKYEDKVVDTGVNLEKTYNGVAIPKYMENINSFVDLGKTTKQLGIK